MKLLADNDVYKITVDFLRQHGHDVVNAKELGLNKASDKELLEKAKIMDRLFITRDKDFGMLVFLKKEKILEKYTEKDLETAFCVVEPYRYLIRRVDK